ncbi:hypothetical protein [Streptomyces sp. Rer75]|uniref:hypothetical protein n=1 Tax=unclassified Streptomyces TaxID=2593676 RepID=UPI0015D0175D|nr:hypothetical protein [Streptomyces sp. Rer75]QLH23767.1 hypothetical protein HYQ63_26715 [Streptomyces sp. Rer75]
MTVTTVAAEIKKSKLAKNAEEFSALGESGEDWFVQSADDFRRLRADRENILARLPESEFSSFLGSLKFSTKGTLASACYRPLMSVLTLSEIFEVFEHCGMAREYTVECLEYECRNGKCKFDFWSLCTHDCGACLE